MSSGRDVAISSSSPVSAALNRMVFRNECLSSESSTSAWASEVWQSGHQMAGSLRRSIRPMLKMSMKDRCDMRWQRWLMVEYSRLQSTEMPMVVQMLR